MHPADALSAPSGPGVGPLLSAVDVHKRYGAIAALRGVSIELAAGDIHGIIGMNGSGKSTLVSILAGRLRPDSGVLRLGGRTVEFHSPRDALAAGIAVVTQETTLVPDLSVAENILLGRGAVRTSLGIDWRATHTKARDILRRLELDLPTDTPVAELRPDEQQIVEIARALATNARLLILDESTSALSEAQAAALVSVMRRAAAHGASFVFVSHRLEEVLQVTNRLTVLRDGRLVASAVTSELNHNRLVELVAGGSLSPSSATRSRARGGPVRLKAAVSVAKSVRNVALEIAAGEILGVAGAAGSGRDVLMAALGALAPRASLSIELDGMPVAYRTPLEAQALGISYVPSERRRTGLVLDMSVSENLTMVATARQRRLRPVSVRQEGTAVRAALTDFGIVGAPPAAPVAHLSGGNQQKVMLAKWMATDPRVLLLDEPTRGVDVRAKAAIYDMLRTAAGTGTAIFVSSPELDELMALCDRILVLYRGEVVGDLARDDATEQSLTHLLLGGGQVER